MRWLVGGPCYEMKVRAEHGTMLAELAAYFTACGHVFTFHYRHTSILPEGRAAFLHAAVTGPYDIALGFDADTWLKHPDEFVSMLAGPWEPDVALRAVLVPQRDGKVNAWEARGARMGDIPLGRFVDAWAVGAAVCAYNVGWYRRNIGDVRTLYAVMPTSEGTFLGEDVWHCAALQNAGARVQVVRLGGARHGAGL